MHTATRHFLRPTLLGTLLAASVLVGCAAMALEQVLSPAAVDIFKTRGPEGPRRVGGVAQQVDEQLVELVGFILIQEIVFKNQSEVFVFPHNREMRKVEFFHQGKGVPGRILQLKTGNIGGYDLSV